MVYTLHIDADSVSIFRESMSVAAGGTRWRSWLRHCATSQKVAGSIPDGVIGIFHRHYPLWPHFGPGVDSASNRNEHRECFLGVKAAGA